MPTAQRPQAVAVDVVETLVSLDAAAVALDDQGLGPDAVERLFTRLLRDGFALAASGAYRPFRDVADSALAAIAPALAASQREAVLAAFSRLDAHPDSRPALEHLSGAGLAVAALTNGAAATTTALLERTGLDALVPRVISIDEVQAWEPAPAPYRHAADVLGVKPRRLAPRLAPDQGTMRVSGRNEPQANQNVSTCTTGSKVFPVRGPSIAWPSTFQTLPVWSSTNPSSVRVNDNVRPSTTGTNTPEAPTSLPAATEPLSSAEAVPGSSHTTSSVPPTSTSSTPRSVSSSRRTATASPSRSMPITRSLAASRSSTSPSNRKAGGSMSS